MTKEESTNQEIGSAFDLLGKSYQLVKKNWQAFAAVNILSIISALFAFNSMDNPKDKDINTAFFQFLGFDLSGFAVLGGVILVIVLLISLYLFAMATILQLESTAGKKPSVGHLFERAKKYWVGLVGVILITYIMIFLGFILLIVPGVIALGRLSMAPYFMIDKDLGIYEAIKASNEMGKKYFWQVLAAVGVSILIAISAGIISQVPLVGALVGTIIAIIFSLVVPLRYQQLKKIH